MEDLYEKYDIVASYSERTNPKQEAKNQTDSNQFSFIGDMNREVLEHKIKDFEQDYDEGIIKNLSGQSEIEEYQFRKIQYELMKERLEELKNK